MSTLQEHWDACTVGQLEKALDFVAREIRAKRARAIA